ncbi:MAG: DUF362 domain-containing protein [Candidatus Latescibacterota bacterium]
MVRVIHSPKMSNFINKVTPEIKRHFAGCRNIAVKLHFGEPGNKFALAPGQVEPLTKCLRELGFNFFLYDSSVAYGGQRGEPGTHKQSAIDKGWGALGEIRTGDDCTPQKGEYMTYQVCRELSAADGVLVVSHFKGHVCSGFGGAIKNLGMGALGKESKSAIHHGAKPFVEGECSQCGTCVDTCPVGGITLKDAPVFETCFGCSLCVELCPEDTLKVNLAYFDELLADGAAAAASTFKRAYYINYLTNIAESCDCDPGAKLLISPDAGYVAASDCVAVDQASHDVVCKRAGEDVFLKHNKKSGTEQIIAAEKFGMGSAVYQLDAV